MIGVELVHDSNTKQPAIEQCQEVVQRCFSKGLLLLSCGDSTLRFCPPLVISEEQVEVALGIFTEALDEVTEGHRQRL